MYLPGFTREEMDLKPAKGSPVWCNTPLLITRSKDFSLKAGQKRFICTNPAFLMSPRSLNPFAKRNELRQRSDPNTVRFQRIPKKLLSCPVPHPHSRTR